MPIRGLFDWAGVAVMKKAYRLYRDRGYRLRLLSAAFRNHLHWSEFIGGDVVISPPFEWQNRFNASDVPVVDRMDQPVEGEILDELLEKFKDFSPRLFRGWDEPRRVRRLWCNTPDTAPILQSD